MRPCPVFLPARQDDARRSVERGAEHAELEPGNQDAIGFVELNTVMEKRRHAMSPFFYGQLHITRTGLIAQPR
jgi:hypothetical protein